jgi:hypothetical protein
MSRFFPPKPRATPIVAIAVAAATGLAAGATALHRLRARGEDLIHLGQLPQINAGRPVGELFLLPHWQEHPGDALWRPIPKVLWTLTGSESAWVPALTILGAAAIAALLTWFLAVRCRLPPVVAAMAGLLPVFHPLAADVLLPWVGQMDLLAGAGLLAALALLSSSSLGLAILGAGCFAVGLLCKESVLPGLAALPIAAATLAPDRREAVRRAVRAFLLLGVVVGLWFAVRAWLLPGGEALGSGGGWYREGERRLSPLELLGRYFAAFFDPRTPQTDYSFLKQPGSSAGMFPVIGALGLTGVILGSGVLLRWNTPLPHGPVESEESESNRPPEPVGFPQWRMAVALVWIVLFLIPYLQLVPIGALWAGRFAFLSLIGLAWLIAEIIAMLHGSKRAAAIAILFGVLLIGAAQINRRAPDWSDAVGLWSSEVRRRPDHAFAWSNLGVTLQYDNDPTAALEAARHATELFPTYGESWLTRGRMERAVGDHVAGRKSYYRAEELLGDHLDLQLEIARLDAAEGYFDVALARLEAMAHKGQGNPEYEELIDRVRQDLRVRRQPEAAAEKSIE